jgi:hypothetical protein
MTNDMSDDCEDDTVQTLTTKRKDAPFCRSSEAGQGGGYGTKILIGENGSPRPTMSDDGDEHDNGPRQMTDDQLCERAEILGNAVTDALLAVTEGRNVNANLYIPRSFTIYEPHQTTAQCAALTRDDYYYYCLGNGGTLAFQTAEPNTVYSPLPPCTAYDRYRDSV